MTEAYRGETKSIHSNVTIKAGTTIVPAAEGNETHSVTLAPFLDHGRPAFIASTVGTRGALIEAAGELSHEESQKVTKRAGRILEELLDGKQIRSTAVLASTREGKPDIHIVTFGDPFNPNSLRLYFHHGKYNGATVLFQDARAKIKDAEKVERVFRQAGYVAPRNWESRRKNG